MRLCLDHTGFHSAGRALLGRGLDLVDVDSLLQLLAAMVVADELIVNSFQPDEVFDRSADLRTALVKLGLPPDAVFIEQVDPTVYWQCCDSAASHFAAEFDATVAHVDAPLVAASPELSDRAQRLQSEVHQVLQEPLDSTALRDRALAARARKADGAADYMIFAHERIWSVLRRLRLTRTWTAEDTERVTVILRYFQNEEMAHSLQGFYLPAVARARIVRSATAHGGIGG